MQTTVKKESALIATGFLLTFCSSPGQTFFISLFNQQLQTSYSLNHAELGALYSLATLASATLLLWTGKLIDQLFLPHMIAIVIPALAGAMLLLAYGQQLTLLFVALLMLRHFGQGLMMLIASSSIVRYLDNIRGRASALSGLGYVCAEAIMPVAIIFLLSRLSWQNTLSLFAALLIVLVLPIALLLLRNHRQRHSKYIEELRTPLPLNGASTGSAKKTINWNRSEVLRDKAFYLFMPLLLAQPMLFTGFIFHQLHIVESKGWPIEIWGKLFILYACTGVISKLLTGHIIDKLGAIRLLPFGAVPLAVALLALGLNSDIAAAVIFMLLLGMSTGIQTTLSAPFWVEIYGNRHIGSIKSLASFCTVTSTAIMPLLMGWLIDMGIMVEQIALASVAYIAIAITCALTARSMHYQRLDAI